MATNDDVAFCGKLLMLLIDSVENTKAIFYYRDSHYIVPGWVENDDSGKFKAFHSHWGDDLAEKVVTPIISFINGNSRNNIKHS